ncbi:MULTISPECIES: DNA cytosine methyltransferase [unclassified Campylobacter]|nr:MULTISPECIES: DNA cytosine methyltransferase [unclassified Campylobacter]MDA3090006.1 DNA cytosine methyltransferase [Campylobacter sp. CS_ED2]MDA3079131.1 DNA cytosine methyltransferase [Campylobacter sp. CS_NA2]MDA3080566.1 DNA cytosine methyltransferase [Campylobacter sp. CS_NA1]MDA3085229.1 DNA cytosine methyltransferase [Campylobacter sp. CS_ED1]WBR51451.1 DNA cytosine methyltransferase [Campylobacter sp. CS_NA3]
MERKIKFIDLFAGIGGFRYSLEQCGCECVFSSEIDKYCKEVYKNNYGETPNGDITKISENQIPDFDILCAGFPCQPFSICGKKKGFDDIRGSLFFDICRIIEAKKPAVVFLENVKNLTTHDNKQTFKTIYNHLENLGYNVTYKILNSKDFGVPQSRERIIIIATKNGYFDFSKIKKLPNKYLKDILDEEGNFEILKPQDYTILNKELIHKQPKTGLIFCGYRNKGMWKKGIREGTEHLSRCHRQPNRIYSINGTHPTIPSQETSGRFWIYSPDKNMVRKLTINECYKLMGFPKNFIIDSSLANAYKQIGNSVVIPMIIEISKEIIKQGFSNGKQGNFGRNIQQTLF